MKPKTWRLFQYFILCLFFSTVFFTALPSVRAGHLPIKTYTSADGLGSGFVDFLTRDSRGFMWFCTRDGLSRFDGSRFVNYRIGDKSSPPGIEHFYETRGGVYWIATTGGTYRLDADTISQPETGTPKLNAEFISDFRGFFFEDSAGTLWSASIGLFRLEHQDGRDHFRKVNWHFPPKKGTNLTIFDIDEASDGSLWVNSTWGLARRLPNGHLVFYSHEEGLNNHYNSSMIADKNGRIWLTRRNRVFVIKPESSEVFSNSEPMTLKSLEPTSVIEIKAEENVSLPKKGGEIFELTNKDFIEKWAIKKLYQTSDGNVWITAENNLLQFDGSFLHLYTDKDGLPNVIVRIAEDVAGNLWIAGQSGLARFDRHGMVTFGENDGASSSRILSINEGKDGTLYFGGRDTTLNRFDGKSFKSLRPEVEPNVQQIWTSRFSFLDSNGDWWFLTQEKLYRFSGVTDFSQLEGRKPTAIYSTEDGLKANGMFQIFEDSGGNIWVSTRGATAAGHGISILRKGENKFHSFTETEGLPYGKSAGSFIEDRNGNIWFGFYEGGLARFDGDSFEVFGDKDGLPGGLLSDLHIDKKGRLWISSTLRGLIRIDDTTAKKPNFVYLTTADGLKSNNIRTITEDRFGRIYLGTARGVDRISPDTGLIKHYSVNDGLAADFVVDSHCDKKGDLWFATNNGVSRLTPLPDEKTSPPQILIGGIKVAGVSQPVPELGSSQIETGEFSNSQNNLEIEFFGLDFRPGETLRYQYKLESADADWSAPSEQRTVTFANLQPANYRFLVRAVNSDGVFSENPAVVSFKILPPIWARWWFVLICALIVTFIIIALYRYRTANLRALNTALTEAKLAEQNLRKSREERLAELEKVRSRIATDLHDDIGASLTQIAVLSEVAQAQSGKSNGASAESLTKITSVSNELVGTMSDIVWSINPSKDHLSDLTQRMRRFASDVFSSKNINFQFSAPAIENEIIVNTNLRREVFLIFKESVNNIVKHSGATQVKIELKISGEEMVLKINDDGCGFDLVKIRENSKFTDGGNGLSSMQKRAAEMNGNVAIEAEKDSGTTIILRLPLEK